MNLRKNNLHILVKIVYIILILPSIFALSKLYENCYVEAEKRYGVCVNKNNCKMLDGQKGNAEPYTGLCEGSTDIQCCIKTVTTLRNGTELSSEGTCNNVKDYPTSSYNHYSGECPGNNDIKLCVPNEYLFAVGLKEIEIITDIKNGNIHTDMINSIRSSIKSNDWTESVLDNDDRELFFNITLEELKNNNEFKVLLNYMNVKHAGIYIGTEDEGLLFDFTLSGWNATNYTLEENSLKKNIDDANGWNWYALNISGKTYVSPDNLYKSLQEYESNNNYFKEGTYHPWCNNCQDFVYWCLKILSNEDNGKRLVPGTTIDVKKENYSLGKTKGDNEWAVQAANRIIDTCVNKCALSKLGNEASLEGGYIYVQTLLTLIVNFGIGGLKINHDNEECSLTDFIKLLERDYNDTCKNYDYSGLINYNMKNSYKLKNTNDVYISSNIENSYDFNSDNNLCFEPFSENTYSMISDNNLNIRCGPKYGKCPSGQCCNKNGKCGTKATFCSKQNGCQPKYGKCKNIRIVTKKKVVKKVVTKAVTKKKNNQ